MSQCHYCRYNGDAHEQSCPVGAADAAERKWRTWATKQWERGYFAGRTGRTAEAGEDSVYLLGYRLGVVALEEAENGYDPRTA